MSDNRSEIIFQDVHVHLQDVPVRVVESILGNASGNGLRRLFCNATKLDDWDAVRNISAASPAIIPFYGIHPWYVENEKLGWKERLPEYLQRQNIGGVGEIGLDKGRKAGKYDEQLLVFAEHVKIAVKEGRPFILHCVHAWDDALRMISAVTKGELPFIAHGFCGSEQLAAQILDLGGYIAVSFRLFESKHSNVVKVLPRNKILIESDFPYHKRRDREAPLSAEEYFGLLYSTYTETAKALQITIDDLGQILFENGTVYSHKIDPR